jgi:hypothetical protein
MRFALLQLKPGKSLLRAIEAHLVFAPAVASIWFSRIKAMDLIHFSSNTDQLAKPGILPPDSKRLHAGKRARPSRTTFVATSTCVLVAATHPCAGAVL